MDILCRTCMEPWDHDSLHEEAAAREAQGMPDATYAAVSAEFRQRGCQALEAGFGRQSCEPANPDATAMVATLYELMGDDMDGAASMLDEARFFGDI